MVKNRVMFLSIYTRVNIVTTFVGDKNIDCDDEDDKDGDSNFDSQRCGFLANWDFENKQN
jgi:hypothetical protein